MSFLLYLLLISLLVLCFLFLGYQAYTNIFQPGAIYFPSKPTAINQMLKLGQVGPKDTLIDLGSGDGRILIAAARLGAKAIGYEINPFLVWRSRRQIHQSKLDKLAKVYWRSFWKADFNQATIITVYLFPHLMNRLQRLLRKKVNHSLRLVANDYPFSQLKADRRYHKIYLYHFDNLNSN
jgi:SAM-dependent methyltransferase